MALQFHIFIWNDIWNWLCPSLALSCEALNKSNACQLHFILRMFHLRNYSTNFLEISYLIWWGRANLVLSYTYVYTYKIDYLLAFPQSSDLIRRTVCNKWLLCDRKCSLIKMRNCCVYIFHMVGGTQWRSWLRHSATSRKVADSIPNGVIGIFHWHNPSDRTMVLGSTQPLTEMSTRNIFWG